MKKLNKLISIITLISVITSVFAFVKPHIAKANFEIQSKQIYSKGEYTGYIKFEGRPIHTVFAVYKDDTGKEYPAYCLNKELYGVTDDFSYAGNIEGYLEDTQIWKAIVNGYPYKTPEELGCANDFEAFVATKQAVYYVKYGPGMNLTNYDKYSAIGEEGTRVLNAMIQIVENAKIETDSYLEPKIEIQEEQHEWKIDDIDSKYISKTYQVKSNGNITSYTLNLKGETQIKAKITNLENEEKQIFNKNEKFKVLLPVEELQENNFIELEVQANIETKPVLYASSSIPGYQNYALTANSIELETKKLEVEYEKNHTTLKIIKREKNSQNIISGVQFCLYNEKQEKIRENLITNNNGEIILENLLPGKYFLEEIAVPEGYEKIDEKIEFKVEWQKETIIEVENIKKIEEPQEPQKPEEPKKLPKSGM